MTSETQASASASATSTPPRTAADFNLPKGDNFLVNSRGQRLHVRTFLPADGGKAEEVKALLVWSHGYAAHVNGPTVAKVMKGMNESGFAVIAIDHHGHGYSDGTTVLITDYMHLVDDSMALLDIIDKGTPDGDDSHLGMNADLRERLRTLPFFLGGQSMGGGLALMLGMHLGSDETREGIASRFAGVMANCPAIIANPPPKPVLLVLKHIIAPMFPAMQLPSFMEKVSVPELVWNSDEFKEMGALDKVGKPGGLGWPGTMRLSTGSQLLDMLGTIQSRLAEVTFPFIVMHDPQDGVVRFEGTQMLLKEATTPTDIARGRELKEMLGMKHDLLSNASQEMVDTYVDWARVRLEARSKGKA